LAEWLVENGIAEERAIRIDNGQVTAARIHWPGELSAGQIEEAVLVSRLKDSPRGRVKFDSAEEALVDRLPHEASEGARLRVEVTRSQLKERGRTKLAQTRPTDKAACRAPGLADVLAGNGETVRQVIRFTDGDWEEIWSEAWSGMLDFRGGSLHFSTTPAMTLVDVDGSLPPRELALAAAKADRKAVNEAMDAALADWPHERTAMNGFGFVQIVSRLERPSLLHRIAQGRVSAATRLLLRRAEDVTDPGVLLVTCHPAVKARIKPEWLEELTRRSGREVRIVSDPALALEAGFAQTVQS